MTYKLWGKLPNNAQGIAYPSINTTGWGIRLAVNAMSRKAIWRELKARGYPGMENARTLPLEALAKILQKARNRINKL